MKINNRIMGRCEIGEARIYITSYAEYMQGSRFGKWLNLKDYSSKEEMLRAFGQGHHDEHRPVIRYLDWENIPVHFISEEEISDNLFALLTEYNKLDPTEKIGFCIWLGRHQHTIPDTKAAKIISAFRGCYQGYFGYNLRFTEYYAKEELGITREGSPRFDFMTFNRYLFNDLYVIDCGFVFRKVQYKIKKTEDKGISPEY